MVTDLKAGDSYWRTKHNPTGVVNKPMMISKEFGLYCLIHFTRADNGAVNCDIYRISDSCPDQFIGSVGWFGDFMGRYSALDLFSVEEPRDGCYENYNDAIYHIINLSENELETHFMSLEFA